MQSVKNAAMARSVPHAIEFLLLRHGKQYDRNNKAVESVSFRSNVHRAAAAMRFVDFTRDLQLRRSVVGNRIN